MSIEVLHDCLKQLPEVFARLNALNNAFCLLAVEKRPMSLLVLPILSFLRKLLCDSVMGVVYPSPVLILESVMFALIDGCFLISEGMKSYFMRASVCYPGLRFINESLVKDFMTVGEAFYQKSLARFSTEEREHLCGNAQSLEDERTVHNPERRITPFLKCGKRLEAQAAVWQTALSLERQT